MSELVFASSILRELIAPPSIASSISERIRSAARLLKWSFSRTRDIWYADARVSLKPKELRQIEELSGVKYGEHEAKKLDQAIERATQIIGEADKVSVRSLVDALRLLVGNENSSRV